MFERQFNCNLLIWCKLYINLFSLLFWKLLISIDLCSVWLAQISPWKYFLYYVQNVLFVLLIAVQRLLRFLIRNPSINCSGILKSFRRFCVFCCRIFFKICILFIQKKHERFVLNIELKYWTHFVGISFTLIINNIKIK